MFLSLSRVVPDAVLNELRATLRAHDSRPTSVPLVCLELCFRYQLIPIENIVRDEVVSISKTLRFYPFQRRDPMVDDPNSNEYGQDLVEMMGTLTSSTSKSAGIKQELQSGLQILERVKQVHGHCTKTLSQDLDVAELVHMCELSVRIDMLQSACNGFLGRSR